MAVAAATVLALGALGACDPGSPSSADAPVGPADGARPPLAALVAALGERLAGDGDVPIPAAPEWPADMRFHPELRAESIELVAVLDGTVRTRRSGRDDPHPALVLVRRFDRLSVRAPADPTPIDGEDFGFRDVVRTSVAITATEAGEDAAFTERRDALERVTLGLAGADADGLYVRDARVELTGRPGSARDGASPVVGCGGSDGHVLAGDGTELVFGQARCPVATQAGPFVVATSPTLTVQGSVTFRGELVDVRGAGWVRRAWGGLPSADGAVVFDRLLLELDGVGLVDAARNKRRSGRGPRNTSATLRRPRPSAALAAEPAPDALGDIEWLDGARETSAALDGVPSGWRLRAPSMGLDVVLEPIVDVPVIDDASGRAWRGGVAARGSHTGTGFVEFVPIDAVTAGALADARARASEP